MDFTCANFGGDADFSNGNFCKCANFGEANFNGNANFEKVVFGSDKPNNLSNFWSVKFNGLTKFNASGFNCCANFGGVVFSYFVDFQKARFDKGLFFYNAIFKERCDLRVESFGAYIDFIGTEFRGILFIDGKKLCMDNERLSEPVKLIFKKEKLSQIGKKIFSDKFSSFDKDISKEEDQLDESRENLHNVKRIFHSFEYYFGENHFYYWYKVYERKCNPKNIRRFFNYLFFDIVTGYFTKPKNVFYTMLFVLVLFFVIYLGANVCPNSSGYLQVFDANGQAVKLIEHSDGIIRDILYFDLITFTTIGYGDIQPTGWLKLIAGVEGFLGVLLISTFLVTLTKKVLW